MSPLGRGPRHRFLRLQRARRNLGRERRRRPLRQAHAVRCRRAAALDLYRRAAAEQGMRLPADSELTALFTTAECARLANIAIWPALVATEDGSRWAFDELAAIEEWLERVQGRCAA